MHFAISISTFPLVPFTYSLGPKGYFTVAGLRKRLFKTVFAIENIDIISIFHFSFSTPEVENTPGVETRLNLAPEFMRAG